MIDYIYLYALQLYLLKKHSLHRQVANITAEYKTLKRKYRRILILRDKLISCLFLLSNNRLNSTRLVWCYQKNNKWWTRIVPDMTNKQFKNNFRVERTTFIKLVKLIGPYIEKKNTHLRSAVVVHKRIACALYTLGSSSEFRTIAHLFGIGKTTATLILHEFCDVLVNLFFNCIIKFPTTNSEIQETMNEFFTQHGYPMCVGAVDGTHIGIKPPGGAESDYYNYKKYHSILMLAVVNSNLKFTYVNIGAPGRCNDASVYNRSSLAQVIKNDIYANNYMVINSTRIQSHMIADSAFSLSRTLLKPFSQKPNMPRSHTLFNYRLSRCRSTIERAFGALKNRFRLLHKKMEFELNNTIKIIQATTILHNLCVDENDILDVDWNISQPLHKKPACAIQSDGGTEVREALVSFFLQNPI
ncbi:unnamed protein product [Rotaria sp. Silwood2]|nr:unnamed protein product [Rotaria sp. Silwood2]CAF4322224.1 unnamed protein product [Rotaria sp. Silwood2]